MKKYLVHLTATSCASVEIEADSPEEALQKAYDETDGYSKAEFSDWDYEYNEVEDMDGNFLISNNYRINNEDNS